MSWPGLTVTEDDMKIDPQALLDAADMLETELRVLAGQTMGTPADLEATATPAPGAGWFGTWQTARDMETGYLTAHQNLLFFYNELVLQLENAIGVLRATAAEQGATDEAGQTVFRNEEAGLTTTPPADNSVAVA